MTNLNNLVVEKLEELTELINEIKEKANEINDKTKDISYSNLKMHEFSWLLSTEVEKRNESEESHTQAFQLAMEHTYDLFTDEEERIAYHVKREYIGRTSSFYYLTDSYGETVDSYSFNEALQGKKIYIGDYLGGVNANLYDYLMDGKKTLEELWEDEDFENFEDEEEIEEFFESERSEIEKAFEAANMFYHDLIEYCGQTPQQARAVLPNATKTEIVVTANFEEWMHIINLRYLGTTGQPHPDIKFVIEKVFKILKEDKLVGELLNEKV